MNSEKLNISAESKLLDEPFEKNKRDLTNEKTNEKLSNFVRGFRREATDFSLFSKRHSTTFSEQSVPPLNVPSQKFQRSSAFFQRNKNKGEPILTEYTQRNSLLKNDKRTVANDNIQDFRRIRREKTESVISIIRNQNPLSSQVKKIDIKELHRPFHLS